MFRNFKVGWVKRSGPIIYKINEGGFGVKTNALIHPTHNLKNPCLSAFICVQNKIFELVFKLVHPIGVSYSFDGIIWRSVRLNVNERCSIQHIQPFNLYYIPISFNYFNGSHTDRIRPPWTAAGKYTDLWHLLFPLRSHFKLDLIYFVQPIKNNKMRIFIDPFQTI